MEKQPLQSADRLAAETPTRHSKDDHPVARVLWVPHEKVVANAYNPNSVAPNELHLLYVSIKHDGFTQPCVVVYDAAQDLYIVVDGFHRWLVMRRYPDIRQSTGGLLPVVVLDKPLKDRMASTVRHNRARGKHSVGGMSNLVFGMLQEGMTDAEICQALGMQAEELVRLKHITGFSKLFSSMEYSKSYEAPRQSKIRREWERQQAQPQPPEGPDPAPA